MRIAYTALCKVLSRYHERAGRRVRCDALDVLGHHLLSVSGAMPNVCFMIQMRQMTIPCFLAGHAANAAPLT